MGGTNKMTITPTISLTIINVIAFVVYSCCLIKLAPILRQVIVAKRANLQEIQIAGQTWRVNYKLLALTILPFVVYALMAPTWAGGLGSAPEIRLSESRRMGLGSRK